MNQPNARPIICGTDFSEPAQNAANVAVTLAQRIGTRLVLVHGVDERGEIPRHYWPRCMAEDRPHLTAEAARLREMVPAEAAHRDIRTEVEVIENRDTAGGICEAADRFDADLICIGSHGHSSLLAAAMGSVAHAVIARSSRPVLVVRPHSS